MRQRISLAAAAAALLLCLRFVALGISSYLLHGRLGLGQIL
jgi:hypothetical protein